MKTNRSIVFEQSLIIWIVLSVICGGISMWTTGLFAAGFAGVTAIYGIIMYFLIAADDCFASFHNWLNKEIIN